MWEESGRESPLSQKWGLKGGTRAAATLRHRDTAIPAQLLGLDPWSLVFRKPDSIFHIFCQVWWQTCLYPLSHLASSPKPASCSGSPENPGDLCSAPRRACVPFQAGCPLQGTEQTCLDCLLPPTGPVSLTEFSLRFPPPTLHRTTCDPASQRGNNQESHSRANEMAQRMRVLPSACAPKLTVLIPLHAHTK